MLVPKQIITCCRLLQKETFENEPLSVVYFIRSLDNLGYLLTPRLYISCKMGSDYGVPDADNLDRRITKYKRWLIPIQVNKENTSKHVLYSHSF